MFRRQLFTPFLILLLLIFLLITACERPLDIGAKDDETPTPLPTVVIRESQSDSDDGENGGSESGGQATAPEEAEQPAEEAAEEENSSESDLEKSDDSSTEEAPPGSTGEQEAGAADADDTVEDVSEEEADDEEPLQDEETDEAAEETPETEEETQEESGETAEDDSASGEDIDESGADSEEETDQSDAATAVEETLPATHVVAAGENLYRISLRYDIPLAELAAFNNIINYDQIYVGQILLIPGGVEEETSEPEEESDESTAEGILYTVERGDTLGAIGLKFGVSWVEIAEANGIENPNQIYEGQVLKIPTSAPGPTPAFSHIVSPGESIRSISSKYGVAWLAIANANHLRSPYVIYPGQTLLIPGA